jgi:hypothetical protein
MDYNFENLGALRGNKRFRHAHAHKYILHLLDEVETTIIQDLEGMETTLKKRNPPLTDATDACTQIRKYQGECKEKYSNTKSLCIIFNVIFQARLRSGQLFATTNSNRKKIYISMFIYICKIFACCCFIQVVSPKEKETVLVSQKQRESSIPGYEVDKITKRNVSLHTLDWMKRETMRHV